MKKNIAVVGCGYWGENLVRNFSELGALACVCDSNLNLSRKISKKYDTTFLNYENILKDSKINGVVLAIPAALHSSYALKAMKSGKDVYVEKPLAMNKEEAQLMITASKNSKKNLMVGHLLQYHPVFIKLKKIINEGKLGKLQYIFSNRMSAGKVRSEEDVIWSFAPHDISMILSIVKKKPKYIYADSSEIINPKVADISTVHMEFQNNIKARISVSWLHPQKEHKLTVIGSNGMAVFDDNQTWENKLAVCKYRLINNLNGITLKKSEVKFIKVMEKEPLNEECKHFINVVKGKTLPLTDGKEGEKVLEVLNACNLSKQNHQRVKLL